ncbi:STAS domain protein [Rubripirellula amarantea]|uniref:STAS domain protein n=1 Tax=Rubripirellula amarantea TaxID=2527999 RepID=A0A5C5WYV6_9BACT|nr:STAS domain-containing protein [Rubripirellula amarantea]TWT55082.1 STAS domain protein [Rubripirellula amarantea]
MQSNDEYLKVVKQGSETTVSIPQHHLSRCESARKLSSDVCSLVEEIAECDGSDDEQSHLNLDFASVDRITSAGLNGLIRMNTKFRSHGVRLVLVNVPTPVREVFELTRLERMFEFAAGDDTRPILG